MSPEASRCEAVVVSGAIRGRCRSTKEPGSTLCAWHGVRVLLGARVPCVRIVGRSCSEGGSADEDERATHG